MRAIAEAPSKVIITGEHFVVHGAWALAAAIPVKTRATVEQAEHLEIRSEAFSSPESPQAIPFKKVAESMSELYSFEPAFRATIETEAEVGAGLGSSASALVALASAVSKFYSLGLGVEGIIEASMEGERLVHGMPSGIDPETCARGGVLLFRPGSPPKRVPFKGQRTLLLSFSGSVRSSKPQISKVLEESKRFPYMFGGLVRSVSEVSVRAAQLLAGSDSEGLGRLLNLSHAVLSGLGVSSLELDSAVDASLSLGSYGAKLTGAGRGGYVVSVAPKGKEKSIISGLRARGFETFKVTVPSGGVRSWLER